MSEEFIRCKECGNLNIQGSKRCVFCNYEFEKESNEPEEVEVQGDTSVPSVETIPSPSDIKKESEKISLPKIPDISVAKQDQKKEKKQLKVKSLEEVTLTRKFFIISLYSILIAIVHYLLNLLISIISVRIENPNVDAYPLVPELNQYVAINAVSIILGIPFAIAIGYIIGKIVRRFNAKKTNMILWFSYAVLLDLIINIVLAIILIYISGALYENDVLFLKLAGSAFIFVVVSILTLFLPMISGSFLIFTNIDKIFFPKKYVEF